MAPTSKAAPLATRFRSHEVWLRLRERNLEYAFNLAISGEYARDHPDDVPQSYQDLGAVYGNE
jgi:hypothetical protein